jgi:hypothetical protein
VRQIAADAGVWRRRRDKRGGSCPQGEEPLLHEEERSIAGLCDRGVTKSWGVETRAMVKLFLSGSYLSTSDERPGSGAHGAQH